MWWKNLRTAPRPPRPRLVVVAARNLRDLPSTWWSTTTTMDLFCASPFYLCAWLWCLWYSYVLFWCMSIISLCLVDVLMFDCSVVLLLPRAPALPPSSPCSRGPWGHTSHSSTISKSIFNAAVYRLIKNVNIRVFSKRKFEDNDKVSVNNGIKLFCDIFSRFRQKKWFDVWIIITAI